MVANAGTATSAVLHESTRLLSALARHFLMLWSCAVPTKEVERIMGVNVMGTFFSYKYAAMQMIKQGTGGRIVGAASVGGKRGASVGVHTLGCARADRAWTAGGAGRAPADVGVLGEQVRGARDDAERGDGLWPVRDHRERVRAGRDRDDPQ